MNEHQAKVLDFHKAFEHPCPRILTMAGVRLELRVDLIREEAKEFMEAAGLRPNKEEGRSFGWTKVREPDPIEMIDALCDLLYVTYGAAVEMGVDLDPYFNEVHRSNMAKLGPDGKPIKRADGKTLKPKGWKPPDLKGLLDALHDVPY